MKVLLYLWVALIVKYRDVPSRDFDVLRLSPLDLTIFPILLTLLIDLMGWIFVYWNFMIKWIKFNHFYRFPKLYCEINKENYRREKGGGPNLSGPNLKNYPTKYLSMLNFACKVPTEVHLLLLYPTFAVRIWLKTSSLHCATRKTLLVFSKIKWGILKITRRIRNLLLVSNFYKWRRR